MISTNLVVLESHKKVYLLLNQVYTKDIILIENHYFCFCLLEDHIKTKNP